MKTVEGITLDWLYARVRQNGDCLEWTGCCGDGGPQAQIGGKTMLMRRVLWVLANERPITQDRRISPTCGNHKCVHPDHCRPLKVGVRLKGITRSLTTKAAIARGKRAGSKWTDADIAGIKESEASVLELAAQHSMDQSYVHYILKGRSRRDFSNPYSQLMAAA